ncbi:T9SS C-terminal target domain-containing protein [Lutibacter sp. HS1-25]|uniref:T9SS type A sorting domain-containing protein n=1 Tax=Lutibacter sp. HS1-25 TaxID=2485000 RepID=UPI0010103542|nr:T9SS type A sorting domain-containing protein [Lutibacter sp. HS1-25]RXP55141.1 T9SS C-terminal target domain-containing protein [Lutibacter sp. HS1-25]
MKKLYILTIYLFLSTVYIHAQTTDVVTGAFDPTGLFLSGNELYYSEVNNEADGAGIISKIDDITANTITTSTVVSTAEGLLSQPWGILIVGNDLYIANFGDGIIYKKDISAPNDPDNGLTPIATGLDGPNGLAIKGDLLYISEFGNNIPNAGKISTLDITTNTHTPDVITGLTTPSGMVFNGDDLYVSNFDEDLIYKIDINDPLNYQIAISGSNLSEPDGLFLDGNTLYIANYGGAKISKTDILTPVTSLEPSFITTGDNPAFMVVTNNFMYITEQAPDKITKFDLSTASVNDFNTSKISMYPNPAKDFINISGLTTDQKYQITNVLGKTVQMGEVLQGKNIDINNLQKGVYFVKLDNGISLKLLKD